MDAHAVKLDLIEKLADRLETVPISQFNIQFWAQPERPPARHLFGLITTDPGCGFAGCAVGWAAYDGIVPGLTMQPDLRPENEGFLVPVFKGRSGYVAVMEAFGIDYNTVVYLFAPRSYKGNICEPGDVAVRLRALAARVRSARGDKPELKVVAAA